MKVGMIGLGKLGLPCLLAMEKHGGHEVYGFDVSSKVCSDISNRSVSYWEAGVNEYLSDSSITLVNSPEELVRICDIIFVAVQTPHEPMFEGSTLVPESRKDFDYDRLETAIKGVTEGLLIHPHNNPLIVVISTVLPGTMKSRVLPSLASARADFRFAYNPYFIAMGTTISDFLNTEFFLIGGHHEQDSSDLAAFYTFITSKTKLMKIESAELTKVAYNTFIGFKIVFANALAEIVESRGGDVDEITSALADANYRIMSGAYMKAGMGDGGGCHPRDQIAMSWLAKEIDMSVDIFEFIAKARDSQTERQADLIISECKEQNLSPVLLGISYKPNSPLDIGSPARLLESILISRGFEPQVVDPWVYPDFALPEDCAHVYFISSRHDAFIDLSQISYSVIIDPWGMVRSVGPGSRLLTPGRNT
jgi:UDPglucose 6-dehydrogenase